MPPQRPPDGTIHIPQGAQVPPSPTTPTKEDGIFAALRKAFPKPQARDLGGNASILEAMWKLVDKRVSACQYRAKYQSLIWRLGRAIAAILKGDRRRQAEEAGAKVDTLIGSDPPLHREPCQRLKGWYRAVFVRAPPPARVALERITAERVTSTDTFHPRERIYPSTLSPSRWMAWYLRRKISIGR